MNNSELGAYCGVILIYLARRNTSGTLVVPRDLIDQILSREIGADISPEVSRYALTMLKKCDISHYEDDPLTGVYVSVSSKGFDSFMAGVGRDLERYGDTISEDLHYGEGIYKAEGLDFYYLDRYNDFSAIRKYAQFGDEWVRELIKKLKTGFSQGSIVPASDRVVTVDDNDPQVIEIREAAQSLRENLSRSNDVGRLNSDQVEAAVAEIEKIETTFRSRLVRVEAAYAMARDTLSWIAREAGGAVVGTAAIALLALIAKYLGF